MTANSVNYLKYRDLPDAGEPGRTFIINDPPGSRGIWYDDGNSWNQISGTTSSSGNTAPVFNIKDFRQTGDPEPGTSDSDDLAAAFTEAFTTAYADIQPGTFGSDPVYLPNGRYLIGSTVDMLASPLVGAGSWGVHIGWGGADGTGPVFTGGNRMLMEGIQFRHFANTPNQWVYRLDVDWHDFFWDVFFGAATDSCLYVEGITNLHMHDVRFAGYGYGLTLDQGNNGSRNVMIDGFTFAEGHGGAARIPGFIQLKGGLTAQSAANLSIKVGNGRFESASGTWAANSGFFVCNGNWSTIPADIVLENITCQLDTQTVGTPAIFFKDATTDNNSRPNMTFINTGWAGFSSVLAGTYTNYIKPTLPTDKRLNNVSFGRAGTGNVNGHRRMQELVIGNQAVTPVFDMFTYQEVYAWPNCPAGSFVTHDFTVTGVRAGWADVVTAAWGGVLNDGMFMSAKVSANDTVRVTLHNQDTADHDISNSQWTSIVVHSAQVHTS